MSQITGKLSPLLQKIRIKKAKEYFKGKRFIDIGCSEGEIIKHLPKNAKYIGIEGDKSLYNKAKKEYSDKKFINTYLTDKNVNRLKIKRKADTIIMLAILEHLKKPIKILKGLKKYLKKNGRIIITTPTKKSEKILELGSKIGIFSKEAKEEHEKQYTKKELITLIKKAGYKIFDYRKFELGLNHLIIIKN